MALYRFGEHTPKIGKGTWLSDSARVIGDVVVGAPGRDYDDMDYVYVFSGNPLDGTPEQAWVSEDPYHSD